MDHKQLSSIERWSCVLAVVFFVVALAVFDFNTALGIGIGAGLGCANFTAFHRLLRASLRTSGARRLTLQLLVLAKMLAILVSVFLAMKYLPISPITVAIGISVLPVSIVIASARTALGQKADNGRA
ncbi:MAG: ATP synthase subunit I [Pseudomonadota bacterium]